MVVEGRDWRVIRSHRLWKLVDKRERVGLKTLYTPSPAESRPKTQKRHPFNTRRVQVSPERLSLLRSVPTGRESLPWIAPLSSLPPAPLAGAGKILPFFREKPQRRAAPGSPRSAGHPFTFPYPVGKH